MRVLVTGASGAVGRALVPALLAGGHDVVALTRDRSRVAVHPWAGDVSVVVGDVTRWVDLEAALDRCDAAVYLVHGMEGRLGRLAERERRQAATFRDAAERAGVAHVVYLGGLLDDDRLPTMSEHMYARQQAGVTLAQGDVPVTEVRAGIVLDPASASFRMLDAAARSPVRFAPPFARNRVQPIAGPDVVEALLAVLASAPSASRVLDVGVPEAVTYHELTERYAAVAGLPWRPTLPLPYTPPGAAAPAVARATGLDLALVLPLLESSRTDAVVDPARDLTAVLGFRPRPLDEALAWVHDAARRARLRRA
ncbi:MAG: NAD(P)H-binding protein [Actinomycetes bacterium]